MSDQEFGVFVAVRRADGSTENVRVGTATRSGEGFVLRLGELSLAAAPSAPRSWESAPSRPAASSGGAPTIFPPYGRSKGMPIAGASMNDLEFYATGCKRTLGDPAKSRFHDKERALLAVIEAEIARQQGGSGGGSGGFEEPPPHGDDDFKG